MRDTHLNFPVLMGWWSGVEPRLDAELCPQSGRMREGEAGKSEEEGKPRKAWL